MANGTIAFDTLTTSDQVNTGTEKSIDTSYIFNGVNKAWVNLNGTSTIAMRDSFNMASVTDNGTGDYTYTMTNSMSNANYSSVAAGGVGTTNAQFARQGPGTQHADVSSSAWTAECGSNTYAVDDWDIVCWGILGDLA